MSHSVDAGQDNGSLPALTLAALGVVYGDIGTSPLYALRECFSGPHAIPLTEGNIYGVLSLIAWSLILVISVKYLVFVLRADNKGEGGILALMALALPRRIADKNPFNIVVVLGLVGAALLYGDGVITPAISVLSAVEGLKVATPLFEPFILVITIAVLFFLFFFQSYGTARIGRLFGPIILLWFTTMGLLGLRSILTNPTVLGAMDPRHAYHFFATNSWHGFVVLGSVFLVVTGGEALYADLGHFGKRPIQLGWFLVALPGLVLQYFGQGALLLDNPAAAENPFYHLAPGWALYPLVVLATAATIIASQAILTGAYSLSQQAVQLGYLPRIAITHTSAREKGQIYVPFVNWALFFGTTWLVLEFGSSSRLAAAYGIAVTGTMAITTILMYFTTRRRWHWKVFIAMPVALFFLVIDLAFFGANSVKILDGGWFPLLLALVIYILMTTWKRGRRILVERLMARSIPLDRFIRDTIPIIDTRVPGVGVFMTAVTRGTPSAMVLNVKHNQVLHERVVVLTIATVESPHVGRNDRIAIQELGNGFYRVTAQYGFMERPNVPALLAQCIEHGLPIDISDTTFFLGRETLIATRRPGMAIWRERIFAFMSRNALRATDYFQIPAEQAIEIGAVVEM